LHRKWLLRHVIEGKIERTRRGIRSKQLLEDLKEKRRHYERERGSARLHKTLLFLSTSEDISEDSELNI